MSIKESAKLGAFESLVNNIKALPDDVDSPAWNMHFCKAIDAADYIAADLFESVEAMSAYALRVLVESAALLVNDVYRINVSALADMLRIAADTVESIGEEFEDDTGDTNGSARQH